jgi:hypothetical protein
MAFKALFIAHAPDADPVRHHNLIETGRYKLYTYIVKTQEEAIKVCKDLHQKEKIDSVLLCPGFTHKAVAEIFEALKNEVAVCVSRGDGCTASLNRKSSKINNLRDFVFCG